MSQPNEPDQLNLYQTTGKNQPSKSSQTRDNYIVATVAAARDNSNPYALKPAESPATAENSRFDPMVSNSRTSNLRTQNAGNWVRSKLTEPKTRIGSCTPILEHAMQMETLFLKACAAQLDLDSSAQT